MHIEQLLEHLDLGEDQDIEFKAAKGGFPKSVWETISAFANTEGGIIVLGVAEQDGSFAIQGIRNPTPLLKAFWNGHNNPQKLNSPVCSNQDISTVQINEQTLICIEVPKVLRQQRPVYINGNPLTGTFKRNYEGDYRCTEAEVRLMLRDAGDDPLDSQILEGFTLEDIDKESLAAYRNRFSSRTPDHPFLAKGDQDFLEDLGGWRRDRRSQISGLTLAGLLMFGRERSLLDALSHFHLDYQEQLSSDPDVRWTDRITIDGTWAPNLFNFYYRVYPRLVADIDIPFKLDQTATRKGETHVHEAMREALINALVHADHRSTRPIKIVKQRDVFIFLNPGRLRIPREQLYQGGVSDPRNPNLLKMFQMLGLGEKAGSGFPKILRAWQEQHWLVPLVAEHPTLELTGAWLPMTSMIPSDVEHELRSVVGDSYNTLDELGCVILMLAHRFGEIGNKDIQNYRDEHPRDIGVRLSELVGCGWLIKIGHGPGTRYRWPKTAAQLPLLEIWEERRVEQETIANSEHLPANSEHLPDSSEHLPDSSEHLPAANRLESHADSSMAEALLALAIPVRETRKASRTIVEQVIQQLCTERWLTLRELSDLLNRTSDTLRTHYINPMLKDGRLQARVPSKPNHPSQAYRSQQNG